MDFREFPRSPGKWNWNWLYFLPFIFTFEQGVLYGAAERGFLDIVKFYSVIANEKTQSVFFGKTVKTVIQNETEIKMS